MPPPRGPAPRPTSPRGRAFGRAELRAGCEPWSGQSVRPDIYPYRLDEHRGRRWRSVAALDHLYAEIFFRQHVPRGVIRAAPRRANRSRVELGRLVEPSTGELVEPDPRELLAEQIAGLTVQAVRG